MCLKMEVVSIMCIHILFFKPQSLLYGFNGMFSPIVIKSFNIVWLSYHIFAVKEFQSLYINSAGKSTILSSYHIKILSSQSQNPVILSYYLFIWSIFEGWWKNVMCFILFLFIDTEMGRSRGLYMGWWISSCLCFSKIRYY